MKLKALQASKAPLVQTDSISNNQNTPTTEPKFFDQSGKLLGEGGAGLIFTQRLGNLDSAKLIMSIYTVTKTVT